MEQAIGYAAAAVALVTGLVSFAMALRRPSPTMPEGCEQVSSVITTPRRMGTNASRSASLLLVTVGLSLGLAMFLGLPFAVAAVIPVVLLLLPMIGFQVYCAFRG